jgi:nucleoside phosphorylase
VEQSDGTFKVPLLVLRSFSDKTGNEVLASGTYDKASENKYFLEFDAK